MTICIGAISENNRIMTITDKMLTLPSAVTTKYEATENSKSVELTTKVLALLAGNVIHGNEILKKVKSSIKEEMSVAEIVEIMKDKYVEYRRELIQNGFFNSYGLTLETYIQKQKELDSNFVAEVNKFLATVNLDTSFIIAGIDEIPHLYTIVNPGEILCQDSIGYTCIGSGSQHATLSLIENEYNSSFSIENTLYALLEAKKRAEYDPGVGNLSDISIIDGSVRRLTKEELENIYNKFIESQTKIKSIKTRGAKEIYGLIHDNKK